MACHQGNVKVGFLGHGGCYVIGYHGVMSVPYKKQYMRVCLCVMHAMASYRVPSSQYEV